MHGLNCLAKATTTPGLRERTDYILTIQLLMGPATRMRGTIACRPDEINDGSFVVVDYETPYLLAL